MASCPTSRRSTPRHATSSSPGTARRRACACPTATGSRPTARASPSATPPRRPSRRRLDFAKLDVVTFSWQKVLGGEAAHGMLILSPRAVERLESYKPPWPLPKIFRLTKGGKLIEGIFEGETINTPSMLCVEDYLDALAVGEVGRRPRRRCGARRRQRQRDRRLGRAHAVGRLPRQRCRRRARTPRVCLVDRRSGRVRRGADAWQALRQEHRRRLEREGVAYDIGAYRDAPPGLRIWCGATVEARRSRGADCPGSTGPLRKRRRARQGGVGEFATAFLDPSPQGEGGAPHPMSGLPDIGNMLRKSGGPDLRRRAGWGRER